MKFLGDNINIIFYITISILSILLFIILFSVIKKAKEINKVNKIMYSEIETLAIKSRTIENINDVKECRDKYIELVEKYTKEQCFPTGYMMQIGTTIFLQDKKFSTYASN